MNKILFASFIALSFAFTLLGSNAEARSRYDGTILLEAPSSSGSLTTGNQYKRGVSVYSVWASSNTGSTITNYFVLIETNPANGILGFSSFATADQRGPAYFFPVSTITTGAGYTPPLNKVADYGEYGITFTTAPYVWKSAATSGQAQRVWLEVGKSSKNSCGRG